MLTDPFSTSPSPGSLFLTSGLKNCIHKTRLTIERRHGLTAILGDVGMGKSSILRLIWGDYAARDDVITSFIPTPSFTSDFAFLKAITGDFELPARRSMYDQRLELERFLVEQYKAGKNVVVFLDEAQLFKSPMLELVRSLLNFETDTAKLIQVIIAGQIELKERLMDESQKAIRSRLFAPSILAPLTLGETKAMIAHRCDLAELAVPFSAEVISQIYDATGGVPREVLKVCAVAYALAQANELEQVTPDVLEVALDEAVLR